ncbi:MAG: hypothetical protein H5T50_10310 [Nitrososphaeria archaeon]|nr:hypothetical protein [Nitrososphaeria archaeon]
MSLLARIEDEDLQIVEGAEKEIEIEGLEIYETESINKINTALLTYFRCVDKNSILQSINDVLNRIDGSPIAPELRLLVSSLLLPLVEVDNNAGGLRE